VVAKPKNELTFQRLSSVKIFARQFQNPLLYVLIIASVVSFYFGERTSSLVIIVMMTISILLGFWNEYSAEKTVSDLLKKISLTAVIIRGSTKIEIPIKEIVVGDTVLLSTGSIVPADILINTSFNLETDESILTGESLPVAKNAGDNVYMGSVVTSGNSEGRVMAIGKDTRFGQISASLSIPKPITEFQKGLTNFSLLLVKIISIMCVVIFVVNFFLGHPIIDSLLFSLAIAIGLTPELLPVIVTVSLAAGSRRLAKKEVVAKQLIAIEDLGNMDILCTDKTGTLTEGTITLNEYFNLDHEEDSHVLNLSLLCNTAGPHDKFNINSIDQSIWNYANKNNFTLHKNHKKIVVSPFDFDQRAMFSVVKKDNVYSYILKGSPEVILNKCRLTTRQKKHAKEELELLGRQGIRVIAVADKRITLKTNYSFSDAFGLHLAGFLAFSDTPKPKITNTLNVLEKLGVTIKVVTGDNELVTKHICSMVDIPSTYYLLGTEIDKLTDQELSLKATQVDFFARVTPDQKVRILHSLQQGGHTVGFLGDGINDSPALHVADVGISVNTAVDVAKDAASIVLLNKDLSVLTNGIIEGRKIFSNTIKYVLMGTSSNFGNMFSAAGASFMLPFLPMTATQILLTNFLYDISQITIPTDNVDAEDIQKPNRWDINTIKRYMYTFGPISSLFDFATFGMMLFIFKAKEPLFQTGWFIESLITEILVIFVIRTKKIPFFTSKPSRTLTISSLLIVLVGISLAYLPIGGQLFDMVPLPGIYFFILLIFTIVYLSIIETVKYFSKIV